MTIGHWLDEVRSGPKGPDIGAFFDFDGTLIDGYSASALYSHRFKNREIGLGELVALARQLAGGTPTEPPLKHSVPGAWSRRITDEHRLV